MIIIRAIFNAQLPQSTSVEKENLELKNICGY